MLNLMKGKKNREKIIKMKTMIRGVSLSPQKDSEWILNKIRN